MTIELTAGNLSLVIVSFALIQWLSSILIRARIEKSIQHEYDIKLSEFKFEQLAREKAENIARLFSKWIKYRKNEEKFLTKPQLIDFHEELNRMSIETCLWIKDGKLLKEIAKKLQQKERAKPIEEIIDEVRKLILDLKEDEFDWRTDLTLWPNQEMAARIFNNETDC